MNSAAPAREYGVVSPETLKSMSGFDFLTAIKEGRLPAPPISQTLGFDLVEVASGFAAFESEPGLRHYNPLGSVHGGYAATLLDSCMGCCVQTVLAQGQGYTTLEMKINLVRAVSERTGRVRAEGRVVHSGRRVATAEGTLKDTKGVLLAHASTTCLVFDL